MGDAAQEEAAHCEMYHGLGDVDVGFLVAQGTTPACQPSECSFDEPSAWQNLEAGFGLDALDDLDDEVEIGRHIRQLPPVTGAVGEEPLKPGPALTNGLQDPPGSGAIGETRWREVDHEQASIRIDGDVALAAYRLPRPIEAAFGV